MIAPYRAGLTLVEIILCLLILGTGMLGAIALVQSGVRSSDEAIMANTAVMTAATALEDYAAIYDPPSSAPMTPPAVAKGWLNGYWVERTILNTATPGGGRAVDLVQVRTYWGQGGLEAAGLTALTGR